MKTLSKLAVWVILSLIRVSISWADFHEVKIDEVMAGLNGDATIQFIELKLIGTDQKCQGTGNIIDFTNHLCDGSGPGAKLVFFNAQGAQTAEFIFPSNTPLGDAGRSILIATQQFANLATTPLPDFIMPANIVPNSGKVCYRNQDGAPFGVNACLAYGSFTGNPESAGIAPALSIDGAASLRRISDSFNNAIDFTLGAPAPRNNAGNCGTVTGGNSCPVANSQSVTTLEDTPLSITLTGSDPDGSPLIFSIVSNPSRGTLTGAMPNLTYTPFPNSNGTDNFKFKVNDGSFDSNTATVTINITAVNDPPVANTQSASTIADTPVNIFLSGSDADGAILTFTIVAAPINGFLSGTAPSVVYTPNANFVGSDSFAFKVSDGVFTSDPATVSITVRANAPPVAFSQNVSTAFERAVTIFLQGADPEFRPLTFTIVSLPTNGSLTGTPPNVIYTPSSGFSGSDSFTFKVNDGRLDSNPATVSISVRTPCSSTPIAFGETKAGNLSNTDCFAPDRFGSFADLYTFAGIAGQQIGIRMDFTTAFDPFLILQNPAGNVLASNDDCSGAGLNSCLPINVLSGGRITLPFNGTYTIEATSLSPGAIGNYTVTLIPAAAAQPLMLTVNRSGTGRGTVKDNSGGINCGSDCSESFGNGATVALMATPDVGSSFAGWSNGPCLGAGTCSFNMVANTSVTADFNASALIIGASSLPEAEANVAYNADLGITCGVQPYSFQFLKGSLPAGLTIDSQGVITGIPIATRKSAFTLQVTDQNNISASKMFSIKPYKAVSIATRTLRAGKAGVAYSATLKGTGGKTSYSWSREPDTFPPWLNLDVSTGQLTGVPPGPGTFALTINVVDALGGQAQKTLSLVVN